MSLRKYSIYLGLLMLVSTIALMSYGVFTLTARPFEWPILYSYAVLGLIHGALALGFAYFNKGFGLLIYFLGYVIGFVLLLRNLAVPNDGFLHLAALFESFVIMFIAVIFGIVVELILWIAKKKKKPADPHLS
jgi:hypothetical protein